jgi:hypothetical protein
LQTLLNVIEAKATKIVPLTARNNGFRDLMGFSGGEDENGMRRWFFKALQQRVKRRGAEHMYFIDNVDLVARTWGRHSPERLDKITHIIDTIVRGPVYLPNRKV